MHYNIILIIILEYINKNNNVFTMRSNLYVQIALQHVKFGAIKIFLQSNFYCSKCCQCFTMSQRPTQ